MSDLISRSELIYKIRGIVPGSQDVDFIIGLIENQPTAFDTEKVVEQLEEKRNNYQDEMEECIFKRLPYHDSLEGKIIGINNAIDIVKKGGVE